ncbi:hypothetical protein [Pseudomonas aeruginosa]|uniref:hypothetical protein n=1 Tax=Pseudomonas aeruginosa TaxID=287 RepID=UPI001BCA1C44|nr:hypothetical protein [Pseudomonas aeruginosa]
MSRRSSSSSLEILLGLLGGALVAIGAFIWRVYTARHDFPQAQGNDDHDDRD